MQSTQLLETLPGSRRGRRRADPLRLALALLVGALVAVGCANGAARTGGTPSSPLRIGVTPDYPPIVFRGDDGLAGVEIDFGRALAKALGRDPVFVELAWDDLVPSLEAGTIDVIMSGLSITPERSRRVAFCDPYLRVGQLALIRRVDVVRFGAPEQIRRRGVRVGFVRETTGQAFVREKLPRSIAYAFDSAEDGIRNLRSGRIDFFVHDAPTVWRVANQPAETELMGLYHPLTREDLAWAVRLDDVALKARIDAVLADWRATHQVEPVLDRWIPVRVEIRD